MDSVQAHESRQPALTGGMFISILLTVWVLLALNFIFTLPDMEYFAHDMGGHVQYTQLMYQHKELPSPYQGWQTYQPPLYYLINQLLAPGSPDHVLYVRLFSIVYGAVFLLCCHVIMNYWSIPKPAQLLSLVYFMSIPAFVHLFTTYNNDALVSALASAIIAAVVGFYFSRKRSLLVLLFVLAVLGMYAKYNIVLLLGAIGIFFCCAVARKAVTVRTAALIVLPLFVGSLMIVPYLRMHTFKHTGKYLTHNAEAPDMWTFWHIGQQTGFGAFFFKPPAITNGEWEQPYAFDREYHAELSPAISWWTKCTYMSSVLSTSLFGEFNFSRKAPAADTWAWITLWIQVFLLCALAYWRRAVRPMSLFLLLALSVHGLFIRFSHPFFIDANYRFFAWITMPLALLTAAQVHECRCIKGRKYYMILALLSGGILAHIIFLNVLNGQLVRSFYN